MPSLENGQCRAGRFVAHGPAVPAAAPSRRCLELSLSGRACGCPPDSRQRGLRARASTAGPCATRPACIFILAFEAALHEAADTRLFPSAGYLNAYESPQAAPQPPDSGSTVPEGPAHRRAESVRHKRPPGGAFEGPAIAKPPVLPEHRYFQREAHRAAKTMRGTGASACQPARRRIAGLTGQRLSHALPGANRRPGGPSHWRCPGWRHPLP
jgi:hypothetical protein